MIKTYSYHSENEGPHLLVTGRVHGNEPCGTEGIKRIMAKLEKIERGTVTFIPVCNPFAAEKNVRFVDSNLNRNFNTSDTNGIENKLKPIIRPYLERADYYMDIHSYTAGGDPFLSIGGESEESWSFMQALSVSKYMSGFTESRKTPEELAYATGTTEYSRQHGALAFTLECGQHKDPTSPDVAERSIWELLDYLQLVSNSPFKAQKPRSRAIYVTKHTEYKQKPGKFLQPWKQFQFVEAGTPMGQYEDGEITKAAISGHLIMPHEMVDIGGEWFYISEMSEAERKAA